MAEKEQANVLISQLQQLNRTMEEAVANIQIPTDKATTATTELPDSEEEAQRQLSTVDDLMDKMKAQLKKLEEEAKKTTEAGLTVEEETLVKSSEQKAREHLDNLNALDKALHQHLQLLNEWKEAQGLLDDQTLVLEDELNRMGNKYEQQPQSVSTAEEDLKRLDSLKARAQQAKDGLIRLRSLQIQKLPKNARAEAELRPVEERLERLHASIGQTGDRLSSGAAFERKLLAERAALLDGLQALNERAQLAHQQQDPGQKAMQLAKLEEELQGMGTELAALEQKSHHPMVASTISHADSAFELSPVRDGLAVLEKLVREEEQDAQRQLANNAAQGRLAKAKEEIEARLHKAENMDASEQATGADLQAAAAALGETGAYLEMLQQAADSAALVGNDEEAQKIRAEANQQQAVLGHRVAILQQSLLDRQHVLAQFNEQTAQIEANLSALDKALAQEEEPTKLASLEAEAAGQMELLNRVQPMADDLRPMALPATRLEKLRQLGGKLAKEASEKKSKLEESARRKEAEHASEEELNRLEKQKDELGQLLNNLLMPSPKQLEELRQQAVDPLQKAMANMSLPPTEQLDKRAKRLREAVANEARKLETKLTESRAEEELSQGIAEGIAEAQLELEGIATGYQKAKKPMAEAKEDAQKLMRKSEELATLPLEELKHKPLRDEMVEQRKQLQSQINVIIRHLIRH